MNTTKARTILNPVNLMALNTKPFERILLELKAMGRPRFHAMMSALASCLEDPEIFLEVGTYQGGSLIGTLMGNHARAWSVENFSEFFGNPEVDNTRKTLEKNLHTFGMFERVTIWEADFHAFFETVKIPPVGLYYYDADHGEQNTFDGLSYGLPHVIEGGFIVADDITWPSVSTGINRFLGEFPDQVKLVFCANPTIIPSINLDPDFWNGVVVIQKVAK